MGRQCYARRVTTAACHAGIVVGEGVGREKGARSASLRVCKVGVGKVFQEAKGAICMD